ncbi:MAG: diguanylate cyclase [Nitrospiraceae bacterium]|nr:MAG: diguanylate cyclase [Nitrospiraceae bacterium]
MSPKKIMIVEDEGITAIGIQKIICDSGHAVTSIEVSGPDAVKKATEDRPDLVLMDIALSGKMDGIEAADIIQKSLQIPIIFLTAYSDREILERIKSARPFGYIIKPFNEHELRMAIDIALYTDSMDRQLREQNDLLVNIIDSLTLPFYVINVSDYTVLLANTAAQLYGVSEETKCYAFSHRRSTPCDDSEHPCIITRILETGESATLEHIHYDRNGKPRIVEVHGYPIFDKNGNITQVIEYNLDVTDRKRMEIKLADAVITDDLTGLFNRRGFFTLGEQQCRLADRHGRMMSLLYIDLDGFKNINDELGHKAGDEALIDTANILKKTFRKSDIIARIGGDEFAVLLTEPSQFSNEEIIISHVMERFSLHNVQGGRKYELLLSIGMAHYSPERPCSVDQLLNKADTLMYEDKKRHKLEERLKLILKKDGMDRRIYRRFRTVDDCWAELDISGRVKIVDISTGGARIMASTPLSADIIYKIKLYPSHVEEISLAGIVVWAADHGPVSEKDEQFPYSGGIKFIEISDNQKAALDTFTTPFKPL